MADHLNEFLSGIDFSVFSEYAEAHGRLVRYAKGESMVRRDCRCRYMGIVKEGYFKFVVQNTKDQEVVTGFSFAGDVITDYVRGFLFELPCPTSIVAGSDAVVLQVPINNVRRYILERKPDFIAETSSKLLQEAYNRYLDLLVKTPGERYAELKSRYPGMIESIPKQEIASYLGVSRRQLHRIRETDCDNESSKN